MRNAAVLLLCIFCSVGPETMYGQSHSKKAGNADAYTDPDVYSVYSVVINRILKSELLPNSRVYIVDQTATSLRMCAAPNRKHEAVLFSAIEDYAKVNTVPHRLLPRFSIQKPYDVVARPPEDSPSIYLSSIGFNHEKTLAVLTAMAGSGADYVLIKNGGEWQFLDDWSDQNCAWSS